MHNWSISNKIDPNQVTKFALSSPSAPMREIEYTQGIVKKN